MPVKYLEITKDTLEIWAGPFTADTLPVFSDDSPVAAKEVVSMPDDYIISGQIWNDETSSVEDTQDSLNNKARNNLFNTDWKVIRHLEQVNSGVTTSLTDEEYSALLTERNNYRNAVID